jgi:hypothetical protein
MKIQSRLDVLFWEGDTDLYQTSEYVHQPLVIKKSLQVLDPCQKSFARGRTRGQQNVVQVGYMIWHFKPLVATQKQVYKCPYRRPPSHS